jgi:hypothetical protein
LTGLLLGLPSHGVGEPIERDGAAGAGIPEDFRGSPVLADLLNGAARFVKLNPVAGVEHGFLSGLDGRPTPRDTAWAMSEEKKAPSAEVVVGYLAAYVFPPVGAFIGIHLLTRERLESDGISVLVVSLLLCVVGGLRLFAIDDEAFFQSALLVITVGLAISLFVRGRSGIGIAAVALSLILVVSIIAVGSGEEGEPEKQQAADEQAQREARRFRECLKTHPVDACKRQRYLGRLIEARLEE